MEHSGTVKTKMIICVTFLVFISTAFWFVSPQFECFCFLHVFVRNFMFSCTIKYFTRIVVKCYVILANLLDSL